MRNTKHITIIQSPGTFFLKALRTSKEKQPEEGVLSTFQIVLEKCVRQLVNVLVCTRRLFNNRDRYQVLGTFVVRVNKLQTSDI